MFLWQNRTCLQCQAQDISNIQLLTLEPLICFKFMHSSSVTSWITEMFDTLSSLPSEAISVACYAYVRIIEFILMFMVVTLKTETEGGKPISET